MGHKPQNFFKMGDFEFRMVKGVSHKKVIFFHGDNHTMQYVFERKILTTASGAFSRYAGLMMLLLI